MVNAFNLNYLFFGFLFFLFYNCPSLNCFMNFYWFLDEFGMNIMRNCLIESPFMMLHSLFSGFLKIRMA